MWNEYVLSSLLHQLLYVAKSKLYEDKEDILMVCDDIKKLIDHLDEMAFAEKHFLPLGSPLENAASFKLYNNVTMQNNIFILMENTLRKEVYTVLNTPNYMKTTDPQITSYIYQLTKKLLKRAEPLGRDGERNRKLFFDRLHEKLKFYTSEISYLIGRPSRILT